MTRITTGQAIDERLDQVLEGFEDPVLVAFADMQLNPAIDVLAKIRNRRGPVFRRGAGRGLRDDRDGVAVVFAAFPRISRVDIDCWSGRMPISPSLANI